VTQKLRIFSTFPRTSVWFPEPMLGSSQLPVTKAPWNLMSSSGLFGDLHKCAYAHREITHTYTHTHTHTHTHTETETEPERNNRDRESK
jgi:carbohydrate-binding DOMON domain-containing protein